MTLWMLLPVDADSRKELIFTVAKGEPTSDIGQNLQSQGLIRWSAFFRLYTTLGGTSQTLQAGDYVLSPAMSLPSIASKMAAGEVIKQEIRVLEAWSAKEIAEELERKGFFSKEEFLLAAGAWEGYLFPDTYRIAKGETPEDMVSKMVQNFKNKVGREVPPQTLIMASILEEELQTLEDKKIAAGILFKRLEADMFLQVDAAPETYERRGLPSAPLSNPGLESIEAAFSPEESPYWYYLSAPDGTTVFSRTFAEHRLAIRQHLRNASY